MTDLENHAPQIKHRCGIILGIYCSHRFRSSGQHLSQHQFRQSQSNACPHGHRSFSSLKRVKHTVRARRHPHLHGRFYLLIFRFLYLYFILPQKSGNFWIYTGSLHFHCPSFRMFIYPLLRNMSFKIYKYYSDCSLQTHKVHLSNFHLQDRPHNKEHDLPNY